MAPSPLLGKQFVGQLLGWCIISRRGKAKAGPGSTEHTDLVVSPRADLGHYIFFFRKLTKGEAY